MRCTSPFSVCMKRVHHLVHTTHPLTPVYYRLTNPVYYTPTTSVYYTPTTPVYYTPTTPVYYTPTTPVYYTPTTPVYYTPTTPVYYTPTNPCLLPSVCGAHLIRLDPCDLLDHQIATLQVEVVDLVLCAESACGDDLAVRIEDEALLSTDNTR